VKAIILAGGFATRLWPITESRAKPLLPICSEPIISHIVKEIPPEIEIIISTNLSFKNDFLKWSKKFSRPIKIFIEDAAEEDGKKGALGATSLVIQEEKIDEDIFLLAGDNLACFDFQKFLDFYQGNPTLAAFDIGSKEEAKRFGVVIAENGKAKEFEEKPENPRSTLVGTAYYLLPKKFLKDLIEYAKDNSDNMGGIFEHFISKGQEVNVFEFKEKWFDIGSFAQFLEANLFFGKKEKGKDFLFSGQKTKIKNSLIKNSVIGKNCEIKNCEIKNSIIFSNTSLNNAKISNSVLDDNCLVENLDISEKMIRQNSVLRSYC